MSEGNKHVFDGSIAFFRDTVFNYPTLTEAYKVAALKGLNKTLRSARRG